MGIVLKDRLLCLNTLYYVHVFRLRRLLVNHHHQSTKGFCSRFWWIHVAALKLHIQAWRNYKNISIIGRVSEEKGEFENVFLCGRGFK